MPDSQDAYNATASGMVIPWRSSSTNKELLHEAKALGSSALCCCVSCSSGGMECPSRGGSALAGVTDIGRKEIRRRAPGTTVLFEGDRPNEIYTVHTGWAFGYAVLEDGGRQILNIYLPGDTIGLQAFYGRPMDYSVEAVGSLQLCVFDVPQLRVAASQQPLLQDAIMQRLDGERISLQYRLINIGRRSSSKKLAYLLFDLYQRLEARNLTYGRNCVVPLTQTIMADALGMSPEYLNRLLKQLKADNLVSIRRGRMTVHDRDGLERFAKLCSVH